MSGKENKNNTKEKANGKKVRRIVILSAIGVLLAVGIVMGVRQAQNPVNVDVTACTREPLTQTIDIGGTVVSLDRKTYFAEINGVIKEMKVETGDHVNAGDMLVVYDAEEAELQLRLSELRVRSAEGGHDNSLQSNDKTLYRASEAKINLRVLEQQIADFDAYVKELEKKINDRQAQLAREGTLLQISLLDWSDKPDSEEYMNLQKQVQENAYAQQNDPQIRKWKEELEQAQYSLNECRSYESQMKSQKESSLDASMTQGASAQIEAELESARLEAESTAKEYEKAKEGVKAEFNGIVTEVAAVEGGTVTKGMQLMTLENADDMAISIVLARYDLERIAIGQTADIIINGKTYHGEVSKINSVAQKNENGAAVVGARIKINDPDDSIILGIEAKTKILIGEADDAITVPNEVINYDAGGAFVMVVQDGILKKRSVEIGLVNDMRSQIVSGLSEGELVVTEVAELPEAGSAVNAVME